jgi:hypothetical protein
MRHLLIASAALALVGGAAFAQAPTGAMQEKAAGQDAVSPNGAAPTGAMSGGSMNSGAPRSGPTQNATDSSNDAMASNAPAGAPPESYPICTSKHQDRCVNRSQATRMASARPHHMKTAPSSDDTASTPATPGL